MVAVDGRPNPKDVPPLTPLATTAEIRTYLETPPSPPLEELVAEPGRQAPRLEATCAVLQDTVARQPALSAMSALTARA